MVEVPGSETQAGAEMEGSPPTSVGEESPPEESSLVRRNQNQDELPPEAGGESESGGIEIRMSCLLQLWNRNQNHPTIAFGRVE